MKRVVDSHSVRSMDFDRLDREGVERGREEEERSTNAREREKEIRQEHSLSLLVVIAFLIIAPLQHLTCLRVRILLAHQTLVADEGLSL